MPLVPDDDMIETLASDGADDPFDITVLPGRSRCRWYIVDSHRFYSIPVEPAVGAVSITDNIARHLVPGERFGNLPCRPFSGRTCSNFEMDQLAAIVTENDEYIEDSKGQRRNDQEIDRGRAVEVIEEERLPCLIRIRPSLRHVPRYRRLADVEAQLQQLSMNPRRAPQRVLSAHLPNKNPDLFRYLWPATSFTAGHLFYGTSTANKDESLLRCQRTRVLGWTMRINPAAFGHSLSISLKKSRSVLVTWTRLGARRLRIST